MKPDCESKEWHVTPMFGKEHELSRHCWCHPTPDKRDPRLLVHRVLS